MYTRILETPDRSFFLLGPRGTGKSSWIRSALPAAKVFDLLASETYLELLANPARLGERIPPGFQGWVVIDEIQKAPAILDEVHRLIETRSIRFALTGSSARKLRRKGINLLAGRARTQQMFPLTTVELGKDFDLPWSLVHGTLPTVQVDRDPRRTRSYLKSYVQSYLREEVQQEGLTRNIAAFSRFLEAASFSQGAMLNISEVARECHVERKMVESYFDILDDLLIATRLPVFARRARREVVVHPKFYFFDVGVWRAIRPRGPLDTDAEIDGPALETLLLNELRALNEYRSLDYQIHYWRTRDGLEVDFVLYGERGLVAFETKRAARLRSDDFSSLQAFREAYPMAKTILAYGGTRTYREGSVEVVPYGDCLRRLSEWL
ncbi:MAG: DUF4143 domain-containing protein [Deltaproteobacteria bacterium]|nr:DUF4143 domain-containing protein [Deltaproteobacteria bacterium]